MLTVKLKRHFINYRYKAKLRRKITSNNLLNSHIPGLKYKIYKFLVRFTKHPSLMNMKGTSAMLNTA